MELEILLGEGASEEGLADHLADTTDVHGIPDTSQLATDADVAAAVSAHEADTTNVHGIPDTSQLATDADVAAAVSAHEADTTNVHGIADTSVLATDAEVAAAVAASEAGQVRDGDAAGGVLSGTYPNPGFAADMATQAELDAHINDATAAHPASAISVDSTNLDGTGTDLQTVLEELEDQIGSGGGGVTPNDENLILHMEVFA